jgi:hypothetical protein
MENYKEETVAGYIGSNEKKIIKTFGGWMP